jgi:hypothetical protein
MVCLLPYLNSNARVLHLRISVPLVESSLDGQKYFRPDELPAPSGEELRPMVSPRIKAPRGPTLRSLVKLALKCDSAEQMGRQLKRRFDRSLVRRGIDPNRGRQAKAEAELDRLLQD